MNTASHSLDPKGPAFSEIQPYLKESLWRGKIFDGDWIESSGGQADDIEPATGSILTRVGVADATDVREAAHKASAAQRDWGEALATDRAEVLRRAAELLRKHQEEVKRWVVRECGGVRPKADIEFLQAHFASGARLRAGGEYRDLFYQATVLDRAGGQTGFLEDLSKANWEEFTQWQWVILQARPPHYQF